MHSVALQRLQKIGPSNDSGTPSEVIQEDYLRLLNFRANLQYFS